MQQRQDCSASPLCSATGFVARGAREGDERATCVQHTRGAGHLHRRRTSFCTRLTKCCEGMVKLSGFKPCLYRRCLSQSEIELVYSTFLLSLGSSTLFLRNKTSFSYKGSKSPENEDCVPICGVSRVNAGILPSSPKLFARLRHSRWRSAAGIGPHPLPAHFRRDARGRLAI